jgi:hypothetical protein
VIGICGPSVNSAPEWVICALLALARAGRLARSAWFAAAVWPAPERALATRPPGLAVSQLIHPAQASAFLPARSPARSSHHRTCQMGQVPWSVRLSGQGDGEVLRPPVMTPGPHFPDQLGRRHGQHRAARMSQAVTGDSAVDRIAQPAPSPIPHHEQVIARAAGGGADFVRWPGGAGRPLGVAACKLMWCRLRGMPRAER